MSPQLPDSVHKYSETPIFNEKSTPAKLTSSHNTKAGVWGKLLVLDGALDYILASDPENVMRVAKGAHCIIEPEIFHYLRLWFPVSFRIEFYK